MVLVGVTFEDVKNVHDEQLFGLGGVHGRASLFFLIITPTHIEYKMGWGNFSPLGVVRYRYEKEGCFMDHETELY